MCCAYLRASVSAGVDVDGWMLVTTQEYQSRSTRKSNAPLYGTALTTSVIPFLSLFKKIYLWCLVNRQKNITRRFLLFRKKCLVWWGIGNNNFCVRSSWEAVRIMFTNCLVFISRSHRFFFLETFLRFSLIVTQPPRKEKKVYSSIFFIFSKESWYVCTGIFTTAKKRRCKRWRWETS